MTKQELINKEYGVSFIFSDENGWINCNLNSIPERYKDEDIDYRTRVEGFKETNVKYWRSKNLRGIEDNNGWNKVESVADLPKENKSYKTISRKTGLVNHKDFLQLSDSQRILRDISHWKEIVEDKMPLY